MDMNGPLAIEPGRCYCCLCHKIFLSEMEANGDRESISICGECKLLFLEDNGTPTPQRNYIPPESLENILSQEFPDMINLARHSRSTELRRVLSNTESDGFDSFFGESDYVFPDTVYGEDSEASVVVDNDSDSDSDSDNDSDTDSDPVTRVGRARLHRSLATNGRNLPSDWLREVLSPDSGIGISERNGIDDGEIERWAPPASASFVKNLECVVVDDVEGLVCVICKESVCVGSVVNRLPCLHVYHPSCIIPWLNVHNTCPLCRYQLPTDYQRRPNSDSGHGGGGGGWWLALSPLVSVLGVGFMLWLGGCGSGS